MISNQVLILFLLENIHTVYTPFEVSKKDTKILLYVKGIHFRGDNSVKKVFTPFLKWGLFLQGKKFDLLADKVGVLECKQEVTKVVSLVKLEEMLLGVSSPLKGFYRTKIVLYNLTFLLSENTFSKWNRTAPSLLLKVSEDSARKH